MIRCAIIDDEPLAREILEGFVEQLPELHLSASLENGKAAFEWLRSQSVDLVFLDIQMPKLNGLELIRALPEPPGIIITTAFEEHALEGFELNAIDYLLKPFSFDRWKRGVEKARVFLEGKNPQVLSDQAIWIRAEKKQIRIALSSIHYIQAYGDYLKIITDQGSFVTKETLKNVEQKLPASEFIRVHKSYVCRIHAISFIEGNRIKVGEAMLPIGQTYKTALAQLFESRS